MEQKDIFVELYNAKQVIDKTLDTQKYIHRISIDHGWNQEESIQAFIEDKLEKLREIDKHPSEIINLYFSLCELLGTTDSELLLEKIKSMITVHRMIRERIYDVI